MRLSLCMIALMVQSCFASSSAVILMYHRFDEQSFPSTNTGIEQFKQQLAYLHEHQFHVLPVSNIINAIKNNKALPEKTIGITIDDAYLSVYTKAWPLLKAYHYPFTIFIATHAIDQRYKTMMTWPQLRELSQQGAELGNHTAQHSSLNHLSKKEIIADIRLAQQRILKETGINASLFAYPYGEFNHASQSAIKAFHFQASFTQTSGPVNPKSDFFALSRFPLNEEYGKLDRFRLIVETKPLRIKRIKPRGTSITDPLQPLTYQLLAPLEAFSTMNCYASQQKIQVTKEGSYFFTIHPKTPYRPGRNKINCTAKLNGKWFWFGDMLIQELKKQ